MPRIAYLGPPGTFTEQATRALTADLETELAKRELVPCDSVHRALDSVRSGDSLAACVPVENSVDGSVPATLDALIGGDPIVAVGETLLPIRFDVLVRRGTAAEKVSAVTSHPVALAQVREWLDRNLPDVEVIPASSTAAGVQAVLEGGADAAVAAPIATQRSTDLEPLATGVADNADAVTRFLLLRTPGRPPQPTGADRTSIAVVAHHEVGALGDVLAELSLRGINLSRIESRPIKDRFGEYRFFLDFDGHVADSRIGDALAGLRRRCGEVRFLGSFPKADRAPVTVRPSASEQAFRMSADWLEQVRSGRTA